MSSTPESIQRAIADAVQCDYLNVEGDGRHFSAIIVSAEFEGLRPVMRHQRVYQALGERMKEEIHALSIKTFTPTEWERGGKHIDG